MTNNFLVLGALVAFGAVFVVAMQPSTSPAGPPSAPRVSVVEPSKATHATAAANPALETHKAPVPYVRNGRQPLVTPLSAVPTVDTRPPVTQQADTQQVDTQQVDAQQADTQLVDAQPVDAQQADLEKRAAQAAVEADGYRRVTVLGKAGNGAWRAKAFRGSTEVQLTVDGTGRVSMD